MAVMDFVRETLHKHKRLYRFLKCTQYFLMGLGETNPLVYNCRDWTSSRLVRWLLKLIVAPYYVCDYLRCKEIPEREGLAFVLIAKNETPYIEEWINFHHKQGVSHFLIYDNDSTDNFHEVLKPYIDSGLVTYHTINGKARQADAYGMAFHKYRDKFKYMAVLDGDEFMFLRNNTDWGGGISNLYEFIEEFMKTHPEAGGLGVNWCLFGSNGHITKPEGGVLENYTMRAADNFCNNLYVKTISDTSKIWYLGCHFPICRRGYYNLDENGAVIFASTSEKVHFDRIRVNHYFTKSYEEFLAKRARGRADGSPQLPMSAFDKQDRNEVHDTEILSRL